MMVKKMAGISSSTSEMRRSGRNARGTSMCSTYSSFGCDISVVMKNRGLVRMVLITLPNDDKPSENSQQYRIWKYNEPASGMMTKRSTANHATDATVNQKPSRGRIPVSSRNSPNPTRSTARSSRSENSITIITTVSTLRRVAMAQNSQKWKNGASVSQWKSKKFGPCNGGKHKYPSAMAAAIG